MSRSFRSLIRLVPARIVCAAYLLITAVCANAVPSLALPGQHHTSWAFAEGAPADVWALAQAPDGYLWLGTGSGLHRFDGERFEPVPLAAGQSLPSQNITALTITPDGAAWIGSYAAGIAYLQHGRVRHYGVDDGLPEGMVYRIVVDPDGTTWAAIDGGLARHRDGRWQTMTEQIGYPWKHADWLLLDRDGTLWVSTGNTIAKLPRGDTLFRTTGVLSALNAVIAQAPDGAIWVSDVHGTREVHGGPAGELRAIPELEAKRALFHDDGTLWGTDARQGGVFRVSMSQTDAPRVDRFGPAQGLSALIAVPVLFDREGNLWVGTNLGLDRFRPTSVMSVAEIAETAPSGYGLAVGRDMATVASGGVLYDLDEHGARRRLTGLPRILAAHADADGAIWLIGYEKLLRVRGNALEEIALPGARMGRDIRAMASDSRGLWVSIIHEGLYRFEAGIWLPQPQSDTRSPVVITTEGSRAWLGFAQDRVELRDGERIQTFTAADGLDVGNVTAIQVDGLNLYIAGEKGLSWKTSEGFRTLSHEQLPALGGITGIVVADDALWFNGNRGVARISRNDLLESDEEMGRVPDVRLLDSRDGVPGIAIQAGPVPTLLRGSGNRLWLATNQGVAWFDTQRLQINPHAPQISIRAVIADGREFDAASEIELPKRTASLRIDYTATHLTMPERVRFRYQLEGLDPDWVDAGTRRQAFYTNPPPGDYTFRVMATNADGIPSKVPATLAVSLPPTIFQTRWFAALCIAAGAGLLWVLYLLRLKELGVHIRSRLHERHLERERIARELHDTLLQSIQGLILRFQAAADRLPAGDPSREDMERVLNRADEVLVEGRNRVVDIRSSSTDGDELAEAFTKVADELSSEHPATFRLVTEGTEKALDPIVRDELFRIGREALVNAYRHANAARIEVEIVHARDELRLRFTDNGRGIDATVLESGRPGHWGLTGMRERAGRIDASLDIRSQPGAGTQVEVRISAAAAYLPCLRKSRWSLLRRWLQPEVSP